LARLRLENEQLRAIFETANEEFSKLRRKVSSLEEELRQEKETNRILEEENRSLKLELGKSKGVVKKLSSMLFGLKSEKLKIADIDIEDTVVCEHKEEIITEKKKRPRGAPVGHHGNGRIIPDDLPIVDVVIDPEESDLICKKCGKVAGIKSGLECDSYQVAVKKQYYLKKIIRRTYASTCTCGIQSPLITAPPMTQIIPKGKYSDDIWVDFLICKYMNHSPIDRQLFEMVQAGINIKAGTVFKGLKKIYFDHLKGLYDSLLSELRESERWHADETRWKMFLEDGSELWQMWAFRSENIVAFVLDPSRSSSVPLKTLFNIDEFSLKLNTMPIEIDADLIKTLNVDRYSAYKVLEKYGLVQLSYCWAHVRRDFIDIQKKFPNNKMLCKWAEECVEKISALYKINNERIKYSNGSELFQKYDEGTLGRTNFVCKIS